jgi:NinB protein
MQGQTIIIRGDTQRQLAKRLIDVAPLDAVVNVKEATRSLDSNAKLWAMLSDVSRAKPDGRTHTAEVWKALFMNACGYEMQFLQGLDGNPFPAGFRSSRLTVRQMADLITFVAAYGDRHGVKWSEPPPKDLAA